MKLNLRRILVAMLLGVCVYFVAALYSGLGKIQASLAHFHAYTFALGCALAFGNYCLRFLKWEFYLARLGIKGVAKWDSFLTFFSGFVLTVTPGKVGEAARNVATLLHPHFVKEEEYALPPLGLLAAVAQGAVTPEMRAVLAMTERLKQDLPQMLAEHRHVVGALDQLAAAGRAESRADAERFAEKLRLHAETEEQVLYPAAMLVGEQVRARLGT